MEGLDAVFSCNADCQNIINSSHCSDCLDKLAKIADLLEDKCADMQDIEFTIEDKKLYILQTRSGKRSASAAIKIVVDMVGEGKITKKNAILRIKPESIESLLHPKIDDNDKKKQNNWQRFASISWRCIWLGGIFHRRSSEARAKG